MGTTWTIARREIADGVGTGRVPLLFVLVLVVLGTGLFAMRNDYLARQQAYDLNRPDGTEPVVAAAPSPLSVFARELDDAMGRRFDIDVVRINVAHSQASANPLFGVFPTPDWLFLFQVVLGLLAFLAGYDLICREKAQGTLKLLLSGGASRAEIALGKWLGNWLGLVLPVLLAALLWLVLAEPLFGVAFRPGDVLAVATFLGLGLVYLTVCFTIAAALSALFHDQTTALVTSVLVWAVVVFVMPSVSVLVARQTVEVRPLALAGAERSQVFGQGMIELFDSARAAVNRTMEERGAETLESYSRIHRSNDRISERVAAETGALTRVSEAMIRLSPAGAFEGVATRVLGTSIHDEARFKRRMIEYKNAILPSMLEGWRWDEPVEYPAFERPRPTVGEALAARSADLVALAVVAVLSLLVYFIAVREYDVR
ncbi:MAG: ABC transporter permease [Gemmatimonadota bacterium]